jgi:hypothetical protein
MTPDIDCRSSIVDILRLLSDPNRQLEYEQNVPQVRVTNELISMWFDDTYIPESKAFQRSFSKEELRALATFNDFYDQHLNLLPSSKANVTSWLNSETWQQIMTQARETLELLKAK